MRYNNKPICLDNRLRNKKNHSLNESIRTLVSILYEIFKSPIIAIYTVVVVSTNFIKYVLLYSLLYILTVLLSQIKNIRCF